MQRGFYLLLTWQIAEAHKFRDVDFLKVQGANNLTHVKLKAPDLNTKEFHKLPEMHKV